MSPTGRYVKRPRADVGMSLVEIMLALTVLTVVITTLFGSILSSHLLSRVNKDKHRAIMDTTALMEQMELIPIGNLGAKFQHATDLPEFNGLHVPNQRVQVLYD